MAKKKAPGRSGPRREKGTGGLSWSESRKRWIATVPGPDGKRKQIASHPDWKQADRLLKDYLAGGHIEAPPLPVVHTVATYIEAWLPVAALQRRASTIATYRAAARDWVNPQLGSIELARLTAADVDAAYVALREKGIAGNSLKNAHSCLNGALKHAVENGLLTANPAAGKYPATRTKHPDALSTAEQAALLSVAVGSRFDVLFQLETATGLRIGELLALLWKDVDLERRTVTVRATMSGIGSSRVREDPKSERGHRMITLDEEMAAALRQHWERQQDERLVAGAEWQNTGHVFTTWHGRPQWRQTIVRNLKRLLERAELPEIPFHGLRHSHATTLLRDVHADVRAVAERLGHDPAETLRTYAHVLAGTQEQLSRETARLLRTSKKS